MKTAPRSLLFGASVVAVVAAVVAGLLVLGPPEDERSRRLDDRRVADLQGIAVATDLYWDRHSRMPESLEELAAEPGMTVNSSDPVRPAEAYGYQPLDSTRYEVCAVFDRASVEPLREGMPLRPVIQGSCQACHQAGAVEATRGAIPIGAHLAYRDSWKHGPGRQCFRREAG